MKRQFLLQFFLPLIFITLVWPQFSQAQSVTIGSLTGGVGYLYGPYHRSSAGSSFNNSRYAYVYTSAELGMPLGSVITQIEWYKASGTITGNNTFNIFLENTSLTSLITGTTWGNISATATPVYSSTTQQFIAGNNSWEAFPLTTSFTYNGASLLVLTDHIKQGVASGTNEFYINSASGKGIGVASSSALTVNSALVTMYGNQRPTIRITYTPPPPCTTPPVPGSVTVTPGTTVCSGTTVTLNLTGNSYGTGQTYGWESSASLAGPYTSLSTGASNIPFSDITLNSTYYRAAVTCGSSTLYSAPQLVTVPIPTPAGTYTLNPALPASATNFHSFAAVATALKCSITGPVIVNASPGNYVNDYFWLDSTAGTSVTNTITINGNGAVLSYTATDPNNRAVVRLNGTDHVTINNLSIVATGAGNTQYGFGVQLLNRADSNTINNCTISVDSVSSSANYVGISVGGTSTSATTTGTPCRGNILSGNVVEGGSNGIMLYSDPATLLGRSTVLNNVVRNFYATGITVRGNNGTIVEGNDISRPTRTIVNNFTGILLSGQNRNIQVSKNRIHDPFKAIPQSTLIADGIYSSASDATLGNETVISNNIVYDMHSMGFIYGIHNLASDYHKYYHNTVSLDDHGAGGLVTWGFSLTSLTSGVEFRNNNISVTRSNGFKYGIHVEGTTLGSNNNNIYVDGTGTNYFGFWQPPNLAGVDYATLSAWQAGTSLDANSMSVSPVFANPSGNLTPGNALLDNVGAPSPVTVDILGAPRSVTTPDPGAYEFSIPACANAIAGTATINNAGSDSLCPGASFVLSVQGSGTGSGIVYQWESSPPGQNTWSAVTGATSTVYAGIFTTPADYRVAVACSLTSASAVSNVITAYQKVFYLCYCSPFTNDTLHSLWDNYLTNVSVAGTPLNNTTTTVGNFGYMFLSPSIPTNTASLSQGASYSVSAAVPFSTFLVDGWIDYDQSGTFDASEAMVFTNGTLTPVASVNIPTPIPTGITGMRLRVATAVNYGPAGACTNTSDGRETEDYLVNILPAPACFPPAGLAGVPPSTTNSISILWQAPVIAPALGYQYYFSTTSTPPNAGTVPTGSVGPAVTAATVGGLLTGTPYYIWVRSQCAANDFSVWTGPLLASTLITNDEASGAIPLTVNPDYNCGVVTAGTTTGATQSADAAPTCNGLGINDDVWYSFAATHTAHRITIYGTTDIVGAALFSGTIGSLSQVTAACGAGATAATATNVYATGLTVGNIYYVRVYTTSSATGVTSNFTICVGTASVTPPPNDPCTAPVDLTSGQVTAGTTAAATQTLAACDATIVANDVWYYFTTGPAGTANVIVSSTYADVVMQVFSGACGALVPLMPAASTTSVLSCIDGFAIGTEYGIYNVAPMTTYFVRVYGRNSDQGTFTIQALGNPLMIRLETITASNFGTRNRIDWTTGHEMPGDRFQLERSADGSSFSLLGEQKANGTPSTYRFWDESPVGEVSFYRLKMMELSGAVSYSKTVYARRQGNGNTIMYAYPNPVSSTLTVKISSLSAGSYTLTLSDVTGKVVKVLTGAGDTMELDLSGMAGGVYLLKYTDARHTQTIKLTK